MSASSTSVSDSEFQGISVLGWQSALLLQQWLAGSGAAGEQEASDTEFDVRSSRTLPALASLPSASSDAILQYGPWQRTYATPSAQAVFATMGRYPRFAERRETQVVARFLFNVSAIAIVCRSALPQTPDAMQQAMNEFSHAFIVYGAVNGVVHVTAATNDDQITVDFFQLRVADSDGGAPFHVVHTLRTDFNEPLTQGDTIAASDTNPTYSVRVYNQNGAPADTYYELLRVLYSRLVEYPSRQLTDEELAYQVDVRIADRLLNLATIGALFATTYNDISTGSTAPARIAVLKAVPEIIRELMELPRDSPRALGPFASDVEFVFRMRCRVLQEFRFTNLQGADPVGEYLWVLVIFDRYWAPALRGMFDGTLLRPFVWNY